MDLHIEETGDNIADDAILAGAEDALLTQKRLAKEGNRAFEKSRGRYLNCGIIKVLLKKWKSLSPLHDWRFITQNLDLYKLTLND